MGCWRVAARPSKPRNSVERFARAVQDTAAARKKTRAIKPGSFLSLLVNARHVDSGEHLSELEAAAQAFTFLLAGARPLLLPALGLRWSPLLVGVQLLCSGGMGVSACSIIHGGAIAKCYRMVRAYLKEGSHVLTQVQVPAGQSANTSVSDRLALAR